MTSREYFIDVWPREIKITATAFMALPEDRLDYRPHPKTRSAREIVEHILAQPGDIIEAFTQGTIHHRHRVRFESLRDAVTAWQPLCSEVTTLASQATESDWDNRIIPFYIRDRQMREGNLRDVCFLFLSDLIHHRGQLSTYYRPMGTRNPFIYGPTAEMVEEIKAARDAEGGG